MATFRIGFVLFPRLTQLDLTGPFEILSRMQKVAEASNTLVATHAISVSSTQDVARWYEIDSRVDWH